MGADATLGDFLDAASRHADAAEGCTPAGGRADLIGVLRELRRLVTEMAGYLEDPRPQDPPPFERHIQAWERSVAQQRTYLHEATRFLSAVPGMPPVLRSRTENPGSDGQARGLARATDALSAGRELLLSHYHLPPWGGPQPRSPWAQALAGEHVALAVADEMAQWAQTVAAWAGWAAGTFPRQDSEAREALGCAQFMLTAAARALPACTSAEGAFRRELLRAIPLYPPPGRVPPHQAEGHAELCTGIMATAERIRAQTYLASWQQPKPGSGSAWWHSSQACAIATDLASRAMLMLASRAAHLGIPLGAAGGPGDTPAALAGARDAWLALARCWQVITTDAQDPASPITADAADLVMRMGRLVSGDLRWTPTRRQASWDPASLAPDGPGLHLALAAIHHAADAIESIARADLRGVQSADKTGRLYMDARIIGDTAVTSHRYLEAPNAPRYLLQCACQAAIDTSAQAARALHDLAIECDAPSKPVALLRAAVPAESPDRALQAPPDILAMALRDLDRGRHVFRQRTEIDHQAIITAYVENGMTTQQISWLFPITPSNVTAILRENGITLRRDRGRSSNDLTATPTSRPGASRQRRTTAQQPAAGMPGTTLRPPASTAAPERPSLRPGFLASGRPEADLKPTRPPRRPT
jgi:hypothetical protein